MAAVTTVTFTAACGSSSKPQASGSATPTVTPTATASASATATATASPSAPPTSATAGPAACQSIHLALQEGNQQGAAGSRLIAFILRNAGSAPCTLYGFPGVSFLNSSGQQIGNAATRQGSPFAAFTLPPGQVGSFVVQVAVAGCPTNAPQSQSIRVYPPNQTQALSAPVALPICETPSVSAVQQGIVNQ